MSAARGSLGGYAGELRPHRRPNGGGAGGECRRRASDCGAAGAVTGAALMARRSPQSVLKRAREQTLREKRELKQAKKDARTAQRRGAADSPTEAAETDAGDDL